MSDELSLEDIEAIQKTPEKPTQKRGSRKVSTDNRDIQTWLKLQHISDRDCEVELHEATVPDNRPRNMGMTVIINDIAICRYCFLAGADLA